MTVADRLKEHCDAKYQAFQSKLVPNIPADTILGVRTPDMRRIAKEVNGTEEAERFLKNLPHRYYEENLVHFFLIALIKDFDACVRETERFLPYVDCWPVCDQSSPKVFTKNHEKLLPYIRKWIASDHVYTSRFGMRMLMNEFLGADFKEEYPALVAAKSGEDYYLKMMIAWYFATALAKQYDACVPFLEKNVLDTWTHNKAIQKALESFRVSEEHKEYLKTLRRKADKA
ncbi:MAG: DNA alkylation repair protein [Lachnospiraceae bacterium]|nr:DNA alkylation repair protein [Lachnospiraceae bacterium]